MLRLPLRLRSRLVVAAAALAACSSSTGPRDGTFTAREASNGRIRLDNRTSAPVFTFVIAASMVPLADWGPCVAAECDPLPARATRDVFWPEGYLRTNDPDVVVYWWQVVPGPGDGPVAGEVHAIRLHRRGLP